MPASAKRYLYYLLAASGLLLMLHEAAQHLYLSRTGAPVNAKVISSRVTVTKHAFFGDVAFTVDGAEQSWYGKLTEARAEDVRGFLSRFEPGRTVSVYPAGDGYLLGPGGVARSFGWLYLGIAVFLLAETFYLFTNGAGFSKRTQQSITRRFGWGNAFTYAGLMLLAAVIALHTPKLWALASWPEVQVTFDRVNVADLASGFGPERLQIPKPDEVEIAVAHWQYGSRDYWSTHEALLSGEKKGADVRTVDCWGEGPCKIWVNPKNPAQVEVNVLWRKSDLAAIIFFGLLALGLIAGGLRYWRSQLKKTSAPEPAVVAS